jgi:hypothetical protein
MIHVAAPIYRPFRMTITQTSMRAGTAPPGNLRAEALKEGGLMQGAQQRFAGLASLAGALRGRRSRSVLRPYAGNGYHYEAAELMACVRAGRTESAIMPLAESVALVAIMERARLGWAADAPTESST